MWLVVRQREARPDVPYWPGRRLLASLDAVVWPVLVAAATVNLPYRIGVVGAVVVACCVAAAVSRLRRAIWFNHRYHFTAWRWGRVALVVVAVGLLLRGLVVSTV